MLIDGGRSFSTYIYLYSSNEINQIINFGKQKSWFYTCTNIIWITYKLTRKTNWELVASSRTQQITNVPVLCFTTWIVISSAHVRWRQAGARELLARFTHSPLTEQAAQFRAK